MKCFSHSQWTYLSQKLYIKFNREQSELFFLSIFIAQKNRQSKIRNINLIKQDENKVF